MEQNKVEPEQYQCADCGKTINLGEFQTFVICDACWTMHHRKLEPEKTDGPKEIGEVEYLKILFKELAELRAERDVRTSERDHANNLANEFRKKWVAAEAERDKLKKFKEYVHKRLDDAGIPVDPESPHKAAGCRIGGRLDIALDFTSELQRRWPSAKEVRKEYSSDYPYPDEELNQIEAEHDELMAAKNKEIAELKTIIEIMIEVINEDYEPKPDKKKTFKEKLEAAMEATKAEREAKK